MPHGLHHRPTITTNRLAMLGASILACAGLLTGCAAETLSDADDGTGSADEELCLLRGQPQGNDRCGSFEEFAAKEFNASSPDDFTCGEGHSCDFRTGWLGTNEEWCGVRGHAYQISLYKREAVTRPTVRTGPDGLWEQDMFFHDGGNTLCRPAATWPAATESGVYRYDFDCFASNMFGPDWLFDAAVAITVGGVAAYAFAIGGGLIGIATTSGGLGVTALNGILGGVSGFAVGLATGAGVGVASFLDDRLLPNNVICAMLEAEPIPADQIVITPSSE